MNFRSVVFYVGVVAGILCMPGVVSAQSNVEVFGQNRVQHRKFDWRYFDTKHFRVYHYDRDGRQLGRYVAEEAEYDISIIEKKLGGQLPQRFNIILYNSYEEYMQTNAGLKDESPSLGNSKSGAVKLVDDKLVVYFTGLHADIRHQIRSGMAQVFVQRMLYGDNLKKMVKNALLLNLPHWVAEGYIAYIVDGWDEKSNSEWKGVLDAHPEKGFYELAESHPELAGKAFWKFVSANYGDNKVKNLLFSMQQKTGLNKAMKEPTNLNMGVVQVYDSCMHYYRNAYAADEQTQEKPDSANGLLALKVPDDGSVIRNVKVSPNGSDVCYVVWKNGLYSVYSQKTGGAQTANVLEEGGKRDMTAQPDPSYPMLAWSHTGSKLAIIYQTKKKDLILKIYNNNRGRIETHKIPNNRFDRVLSMAFTEDDDKMVFSAIRKSQTDLYMFTIRGSRISNITDDAWDDLSPQYISGGSKTGILFLSNRPKPELNLPVGVNELPAGPLNVFFYNTTTGSTELLQCTDVKRGRISQPVQYGLNDFAYLHDSNGINNRYVVRFARDSHNKDSAYSQPVTNYNSSILSHQYSFTTGDVADVVQQKNKYMVYFHDMLMPGDGKPAKTLTRASLTAEPEEHTSMSNFGISSLPDMQIHPEELTTPVPPSPEVKSGNVFQSEFDDVELQPHRRSRRSVVDESQNGSDEGANSVDSSLLTELTDSAYVKMKPSRYRFSFKPDFLSVKLDNTVLFTPYQSIQANGGQYQNPTLSGLANLSLNELMENHRLTAGFQFPIDGAYSTYFLQYQNFTRRLDWGGFFLRRQNKSYEYVRYVDASGNTVFYKQQLIKVLTNMAQIDLSYPIDKMRSVRFHTNVREDNFIQKVTDTLSLVLDFQNTETYTSMSRMEYVFDNTVTQTTNILNGMRYKAYVEYIYGLNKGNRSCYNIGIDFRNYQKIYKNFIVANRVAWAHSDGNNMVEYLAGGVDNWMFPQQSSGAGSPPGDNYGFQALATSLRGYLQYARTGNNYAVFTTEFRLPAVTTFVKRPVQSAILKNLQVVAFLDVGNAWQGFLPTGDNLSPPKIYPQPGTINGGLNNVSLSISQVNGWAVGFGPGLRSSLFGYFVRLDAAWNIEGNVKPVVYFALGTDF